MPEIQDFDQCEQEQQQFLSELRERILSKLDISPKLEGKLNDKKFLLRYLLKYDWDLDRSEKAIVNYMKLNEEFDRPCAREREYPKEILDLCHGYFCGVDDENRLVMIIPNMGKDSKEFLDRADEATIKLLHECAMKTVITAEKVLDEKNLESGVLIFDLCCIPYGQYFHKKSMEFMLHIAKAVTKLLPSFVGKVIIVNAPWPIKGFLKVLLSFVKIPAEVVVCSPKPIHWKKELLANIPASSLPIDFGGTLKHGVGIERLRDALFKAKK